MGQSSRVVRQQGKARSGPGTLGNGLGGQAGGWWPRCPLFLSPASLVSQPTSACSGHRAAGSGSTAPVVQPSAGQGPRVAKRPALLLDFQKSAGHDSLGIQFLGKQREKSEARKDQQTAPRSGAEACGRPGCPRERTLSELSPAGVGCATGSHTQAIFQILFQKGA